MRETMLLSRPVAAGEAKRYAASLNETRKDKTMKTLLILFTLMLFPSAVTLAQDSGKSDKAKEEEAIRQTIQYYFEGYSNKNIVNMGKAFHPDAKTFVVRDGVFKEIPESTIEESMASSPQPNPNPNTVPKRIVSIDISGEIAAVKIEMEYDNGKFPEYLSLIKILDEWKIVSRVITPGLRCVYEKRPQRAK